jgi:uncharacterized protein (DUF302 family)
MKNYFLGISLLFCLPVFAQGSDNGLISKPSKYSVSETLDRLEKVAKSKGATVFARIDHSGEAEKAGLKMRPTQLLIIGNPKSGTPLMNSTISAAIDLPLKALAWEDENGKVWLSYNSPSYLQKRHGFADELVKNVAVIGVFIDQALE